MFDYPDNKSQMNLQKIIWYGLIGALMLLSSIGGAWAMGISKTVSEDHTSVAVVMKELQQIHQDLEDIKQELNRQH